MSLRRGVPGRDIGSTPNAYHAAAFAEELRSKDNVPTGPTSRPQKSLPLKKSTEPVVNRSVQDAVKEMIARRRGEAASNALDSAPSKKASDLIAEMRRRAKERTNEVLHTHPKLSASTSCSLCTCGDRGTTHARPTR